MNDDNSSMAIYISIMTLVFSCVGLGYGLLFFGWGPKGTLEEVAISPRVIIVIGLVLATINGMASNVLSGQIEERLKNSSPSNALKVGIPLAVFLITLVLSILIAIMSS